MKTLLLTALLAAIPAASALTLTGTITGTALANLSSVPGPYQLGDSWSVGYSYNSPTVDGSFTAAAGTLHLWHIAGVIDLPDDSNRTRPAMVVANGKVQQFNAWNWTWCVTTTTWTWDGMVFGSVAFSDPVAVQILAASSPVPDGGWAGLMLGAVFGVLVFLRRL